MSVSPVGNLQSSRTFSLSKTSMVWAPIVKPEKMRTKRILERVHYTFKCSGRGKSFEEERCQMLPRHRYLHIPPPPPRKHEFLFFCKLGVLLFTTPTECVHLIFARLQLGIFFTILLAAYLFFFSAKILRLYASFKRRLFTYIILLTKKDNWPLSFEFFTLGPYFSPICVQDPFLSHLHYSFFS